MNAGDSPPDTCFPPQWTSASRDLRNDLYCVGWGVKLYTNQTKPNLKLCPWSNWGYLAYTNLALNPNCHLALITLTLKQGADVCDGCFWVGAGQMSSHVITAAAYISLHFGDYAA